MPNLPYQTASWPLHTKVARAIRFPVAGDLTALEVEFTYEGPRANYIPAALGSVEPEYAEAGQQLYLSRQGDLTPIGGGAVRYTRAWASIPATQYEPDGVLLARPSLHDVKINSAGTDYYAVSFDEGRRTWAFTTGRKAVSSLGAISTRAPADFTGGTITLTWNILGTTGTETASLTASAATISSDLSYSSGGTSVTPAVTKSPGIIALDVSAWSVTITTDQSNVQIDGAIPTPTIRLVSAAQSASADAAVQRATRVITTSASHGGATGDHVACWNGDKLVAVTKAIAASGSSITVPADEGALAADDVAITHVGFAAGALFCVANGPADCSARLVRRFYLPGVTTGISNQADIPGFVSVTQDPVSWFTALVARGTLYTNLLLQSETFGTTWTTNEGTRTADVLANPIGGGLSRLLETAANNYHGFNQAYTFSAIAYAYSAYFRGGLGRDWVVLWADDGTVLHHCFFNLTTGTVGTATNCTGTMELQADGLTWRCWITFTATAGAGFLYLMDATADASPNHSFAGDTAKGYYVGQSQLVAGTVPGPYVKTLTATATTLGASEDAWVVHSTEKVTRWLGGPILEKDVLEVQLADAITPLPASA